MPVKQFIGLFILLLFLYRASSGQSNTVDFPVHRGNFTFSFSRDNNMLALSGNAVVKQLALHLLIAPEKTRYKVTYSYNLLSVNVKDGILMFSFRLDIDSVSGDVKAGVFDVSDVLRPRVVSFELDLIDDEGRLLDTINISKFEPGQDTLFKRSFYTKPDYYSRLTDVKLKRVQFGYDKNQQISVINKLNAIKAYQAACMLCDSIQMDADRLNRQAVAPSPELAIQIFQLSGAVRLLGQLFRQWAVVPGSSDPAYLQQRQKMLAYRVSLIQELFLKQAVQIQVRMPRKNIQGLAQWWVADQMNLLTEKRFPGFAAAVFCKLGKLSFSAPDLAFLNKSLTLMTPMLGSEGTPQLYAWVFSDAASKVYLKQSSRLSADGRYTEAADLLGNAVGICSAIPYITCSDLLIKQQARAYYGSYYSYLGVARKALASNLPDIASGYIASAAAFQKENSRFILVNSEMKELCKRLADIWFSLGNTALESGKRTEALHYFEKAEWASAIANSGVASNMISAKLKSVYQQKS